MLVVTCSCLTRSLLSPGAPQKQTYQPMATSALRFSLGRVGLHAAGCRISVLPGIAKLSY